MHLRQETHYRVSDVQGYGMGRRMHRELSAGICRLDRDLKHLVETRRLKLKATMRTLSRLLEGYEDTIVDGGRVGKFEWYFELVGGFAFDDANFHQRSLTGAQGDFGLTQFLVVIDIKHQVSVVVPAYAAAADTGKTHHGNQPIFLGSHALQRAHQRIGEFDVAKATAIIRGLAHSPDVQLADYGDSVHYLDKDDVHIKAVIRKPRDTVALVKTVLDQKDLVLH